MKKNKKSKKQIKKQTAKKIFSKKNIIIFFASVILAAIIVFAGIIIVKPYTAEGVLSTLKASFSVDGNDMTLSCFKGDFGYYFVFPDGSDVENAVFSYSGKREIEVGNKVLANNEKSEILSDVGDHKIKIGEKEFTLSVSIGEKLPVIKIDTESGSLDYVHKDKSNKEAASISVFEDGKTTLSAELKYIKGRGNSTWECDKKSYNIKFEEKTDFLGLGEAKKFCLITTWFDNSYIPNSLGYELAEIFGCSSTPSGQLAIVYFNDEYHGIYFVSEPVEVGKNRIEINNLDDANEEANADIDIAECKKCKSSLFNKAGSYKWVDLPNEPDDITGGYLLELERDNLYKEEACGFITENNQPVVIKSPEYASRSEVEFIRSIWTEAEEALYSDSGYNSAGKHFSEYFDVDSLVSMLLLQEFVMQGDVSQSSCFFYYDNETGKIYAGPVWDLDCGYIDNSGSGMLTRNSSTTWAAALNNTYYRDITSVFFMIAKHEEIRDKLFTLWQNVRETLTDEKIENIITELWSPVDGNSFYDCMRWGLKSGLPDEETVRHQLNDSFDYTVEFCRNRTKCFDTYFNENNAVLYYYANDGSGYLINNTMCLDGDTVKIIDNKTAKKYLEHPFFKFRLTGWNTKPDGTGEWYYANEEITLKSGNNILYAQWE